jgi:transcriptional regulator
MSEPAPFKKTDLSVLHAFIEETSFGMLASSASGSIQVSHVPFLLDRLQGERGTLKTHLARSNPQWKDFQGDAEAALVFQGPHAYVSPSFYRTELSVPTWNYAIVRAWGVPRIVEGPETLRGLLEALTDKYEKPRANPWSLSQLPDDFIQKMMKGIVGVEIPIHRLEGKFKLGQNRNWEDRWGAVRALSESPLSQDRELAERMRREIDSERPE